MTDLALSIYSRSPVWMQNLACALAGWQRSRLRYGGEFERWAAFYERSARWSEPELLEYQREQVRLLIRECFEEVPYYFHKWTRAKLGPSDFRHLDDLRRFPLIERDELFDAGDRLLKRERRQAQARVLHHRRHHRHGAPLLEDAGRDPAPLRDLLGPHAPGRWPRRSLRHLPGQGDRAARSAASAVLARQPRDGAAPLLDAPPIARATRQLRARPGRDAVRLLPGLRQLHGAGGGAHGGPRAHAAHAAGRGVQHLRPALAGGAAAHGAHLAHESVGRVRHGRVRRSDPRVPPGEPAPADGLRGDRAGAGRTRGRIPGGRGDRHRLHPAHGADRALQGGRPGAGGSRRALRVRRAGR